MPQHMDNVEQLAWILFQDIDKSKGWVAYKYEGCFVLRQTDMAIGHNVVTIPGTKVCATPHEALVQYLEQNKGVQAPTEDGEWVLLNVGDVLQLHHPSFNGHIEVNHNITHMPYHEALVQLRKLLNTLKFRFTP